LVIRWENQKLVVSRFESNHRWNVNSYCKYLEVSQFENSPQLNLSEMANNTADLSKYQLNLIFFYTALLHPLISVIVCRLSYQFSPCHKQTKHKLFYQ